MWQHLVKVDIVVTWMEDYQKKLRTLAKSNTENKQTKQTRKRQYQTISYIDTMKTTWIGSWKIQELYLKEEEAGVEIDLLKCLCFPIPNTKN